MMMSIHCIIWGFSISALGFVLGFEYEPLVITSLLEAGNYQEAQKRSLVTPDIAGVKSYAGFFNVDKNCGCNLFFWFFSAEKNWKTAPVLLWLATYPTRTVLAEIFLDVGPFNYTRKYGFRKRKYSWSNENNVLYIEQPVGVGFSYTEKMCYRDSLSKISKDVNAAISQFFHLFPNLLTNKFFIVGQNFAGRYAPGIALEIDESNKSSSEKINLIGILVGGPYLDERCNNYAKYKFILGIVDRKERDRVDNLYKKLIEAIDTKNYTEAAKLKEVNGIWQDPIYVNILYDKYIIEEFQTFIRKFQTRLQIHVGDKGFNYYSHILDKTLRPTVYEPVTPYIEKVLNTGRYIVGFYGGQLDDFNLYTSIPCVLEQLKWPGAKDYLEAERRRWYVDGRLAGWVKMSGNVWEIAVRGSGLYSTRDQPEVIYTLIQAAVADKPGGSLLSGITLN